MRAAAMTAIAKSRERVRGRFAAALVLAALPSATVALPDDLDARWGQHGAARFEALQTFNLISGLAVTADGHTYANAGCSSFIAEDLRGVFRLLPSGQLDNSFGRGNGFTGCPSDLLNRGPTMFVTPRGEILLIAAAYNEVELLVARYSDNGVFDRQHRMPLPPILLQQRSYPAGYARLKSLRLDATGRIVAGMSITCGDGFECTPTVVRWNVDGMPDTSFGDGGVVFLPPYGAVTALALHADERISVAITDEIGRGRGIRLARLKSDGSLDASFGEAGLVSVPPWSSQTFTHSVVLQPDGKLIVAGTTEYAWVQPSMGRFLAFAARFDERGFLDNTFADHGVLIPRTLGDTARASIALQPDGKLVLAGSENIPRSTRGFGALSTYEFPPAPLFVGRFMSDGSPDLHFAGAGIASLPTGFGPRNVQLALRPDGRVVLGDALRVRDGRTDEASIRYPVIYQLEGGVTPLPRLFRDKRAIEYFHAGFDHYFVTALDVEIENLDVHNAGGWARTGRSFRVWIDSSDEAVPVCRFFSDQTFAPKSSHFYTSYAAECEQLKRGSAWTHEGTAFFMKQPVGTPGAGICPTGSRPLYRAYNNGQSGAPNHRYTIDPLVLDEMIAKGWTFEGEVQTRIFACVPLLQ